MSKIKCEECGKKVEKAGALKNKWTELDDSIWLCPECLEQNEGVGQ